MMPALLRRPTTGDWTASLLLFLVSLPMALGIAMASGVSPASGLISAVVGATLVATLSGAALQVSGPSAILAVVVLGMVQQFGWEVVCMFVVVAGLLQVVIGLLRLPQYMLALSPAIIYGLVCGFGVLTALSQLQLMLGGLPRGDIVTQLRGLGHLILHPDWKQAVLGGTAMAVVVVHALLPKKWSRWIPGSLLAVVAGTAVSLSMDVPRVVLPGEWKSIFSFPSWSALKQFQEVFKDACMIVLIASSESLITAVAIDKLRTTSERVNLNRELIAQGVGNMVSGLLGGLPMSGAIVRSSASIQAGAQTRWASVLHGVWLVAAVFLFRSWISWIPKSVLAGLIVVAGFRLISFKKIKDLYVHREWIPFVATWLGVCAFNMLVGVGLGVAVALFFLLRRLVRVKIDLQVQETTWHFLLRGQLTFLVVPKMMAWLDRVPNGTHVVLELQVDGVDHAALEALRAFRTRHEAAGGTVQWNLDGIVGISSQAVGQPVSAAHDRKAVFPSR